MFRKILKKDLKRKKAMNTILFILMLTASILIAGSTNLLYSTVTAVDYFIDKSGTADLITLTNSDQEIIERIEDWAKKNNMVKEFVAEDVVMLDEKKVTASTGKELRNTSTLGIMTKPEKYNKIFDPEGKDFEVGPSEAAVPVSVQKKMNLVVGDHLTIEVNGYKKEFTICNIFKDAVLGAELMGMKRIILNEADFNTFYGKATEKELIKFWGFTKADGFQERDLENDFSGLVIPTYTVMSKNTVNAVYILDMTLAAIMIIVSIFLILISFLILRFTIVFTVMEDYKQIGVMKAIGLNNGKIRRIYSIKYLMLSAVSGGLGFIISIPVSGLMKKNISEYILLKESAMNMIISLISILAVVGITMLFCNLVTGKIKKISAVEAIRQGNSGERFTNTKKLKLNRRRKVNIPFFLAFSDIISDLKKYIILIVTFVLGTAIIIIPNNVISTLTSDDTITMFGYCRSDFYLRDDFMGNQTAAKDRMRELSDLFEKKGFQVKFKADLITNGKLYTMDKSETLGILGLQGIGVPAKDYHYLDGTAPKLLNEIAITEKAAETLKVGIGDSILCELQGENKEYIITGFFQTFNSLGNAVRLSQDQDEEEGISTSITISGDFIGASDRDAEFEKLKETFPELEIKKGTEIVDTFVGDIAKQIRALKNLIFIIVIGINFLITSLLLRMLISKEVPEIAILKSLGFPEFSIKQWQLFRIGILLAVSIVIGTVLANSTGNFLTSGIFKVMGITRLKLFIEPLQVYFIYPGIIFVITMLSVFLSLGQIRKTHVWELNNQE